MKWGKQKGPRPVDVHVGKRIRQMRVTSGMSQTELADQLGLTFQQLQKYESGANRCSASRLWDIAQALDQEISWFFVGLRETDPAVIDRRETRRGVLELARRINRCSPPVRKAVAALLDYLPEHVAPAE